MASGEEFLYYMAVASVLMGCSIGHFPSKARLSRKQFDILHTNEINEKKKSIFKISDVSVSKECGH
jgi:hypothetical protein